jgi:hypothetical protein
MALPLTWQTAALRGAAYCCYSSQCVMGVCAGCVADELQLIELASQCSLHARYQTCPYSLCIVGGVCC